MTKAQGTHTATRDIIQLTWERAGVRYSREWPAGPESRDAVRAQRLGLLGSGARNVSSEIIPAGGEYTAWGEECR